MAANNKHISYDAYSIIQGIVIGTISIVSLYYFRNVNVHILIRIMLLIPLISTTGDLSEVEWNIPSKLMLVYYITVLGFIGQNIYKAFKYNPPVYEHILYLIAAFYFLHRTYRIINDNHMFRPKKEPAPDIIAKAGDFACKKYTYEKHGKEMCERIYGELTEEEINEYNRLNNMPSDGKYQNQTNSQTNPYAKREEDRPKINYGSREQAYKEALKELDNIIGMEALKEEINKLLINMIMMKRKKKQGSLKKEALCT